MNLKSLLFIGLACMAGGGIASLVCPKPADAADRIAFDLGCMFWVLVGVALVITHFVRQKNRGQ